MSEMGQRLWSDQEFAAAKIDQIPAKRFGNITEITVLILFLGSDQAAFVNGSIIGIDGGLFAGSPDSGQHRWPDSDSG